MWNWDRLLFVVAVVQTTEQVKSLLLDDRPAAQPHQQQRRPAEEEAADMPVLSVWQVFQPSESAAAGTGSSTRKRRASARYTIKTIASKYDDGRECWIPNS